jgi:SAM-dependent methyltransferase
LLTDIRVMPTDRACKTEGASAMGTAQMQGELWGARPKDWSTLQEVAFAALYDAAFDAVKVGRGTSLLDVGCGAGLALEMATGRGADVSGLDAAAPLADVARSRTPSADIRVGEMEELPFADGSFDVVTGFNSFQYAADPVGALTEARRVTKDKGNVVIAIWGMAEQCEMAGYLAALGGLMPPPPPGAPGPFALSAPGALESLAEKAGLHPKQSASAPVEFKFVDEATAVRGLLAPGPATRAIGHSGEEAVRKGIAEAIAPYRREDGSYFMQNEFRYLITEK